MPVKLVAFEDPGVAGKLDRESGRAEIQVNKADSYRRQNFTVAHELGHFTLHPVRTWSDTKETMYRRSNWQREPASRQAEYQANLFAAALLMPEAAVKERWSVLKSPHYLAPIFRVSRRAMTRRLEELGEIVPSVPGINYLDLTPLSRRSGAQKPQRIVEEFTAVPTFSPVRMDAEGRIIPMSREEREARSSALIRVLDAASNSRHEDPEQCFREEG